MDLPTISLPKIADIPELSRLSKLAAPGAAIVVSLVVFFLVAWPKFTQVLAMRSTNQEIATRAENLAQKAQILASLDRDELTSQLEAAERILPSDKDLFALVWQVEKATAISGVILQRLEAAPGTISSEQPAKTPTATPVPSGSSPKSGEIAPKVQLRVSLVGDYGSLLQFLAKLANIARIVEISDLTVSAATATGQTIQLRTSLTLNGFWQALPRELASIESPIEVLTEPEMMVALRATQAPAELSPTIGRVPLGRSDLFAPF